MKLDDLIKPTLSMQEAELLHRAEKIHQDPQFHVDPKYQQRVLRLIKLGLLRRLKTDGEIHYERTLSGQEFVQR